VWQLGAQVAVVAITGVEQHHPARQTGCAGKTQLLKRNLRLGFEPDVLGHMREMVQDSSNHPASSRSGCSLRTRAVQYHQPPALIGRGWQPDHAANQQIVANGRLQVGNWQKPTSACRVAITRCANGDKVHCGDLVRRK
jgi:hypothetical protein